MAPRPVIPEVGFGAGFEAVQRRCDSTADTAPLRPQGKTGSAEQLGIICQRPKIACKQKKKKSGSKFVIYSKNLNREALSVF